MTALFRRVGSVRLAVFLLMLLAAVAAVGTSVPQGLRPEDYERLYPAGWRTVLALGLDRFYTGWVYRSLLGILAANLLACGARRSWAGWERLLGRGAPSARWPLGDREQWRERLRGAGFRVSAAGPLRASRRPWGFLGFPLVHLAPFLFMAGGLWGSLGGYVGTRNIYVGDSTRTADRWPSGSSSPLPFTLRVSDFRLVHHPVQLRVGFLLPEGTAPEATLREGSSAPVPGTGYRVFVQRFDPAGGDLVYFLEDPAGRRLGPFSKGKEEGAPLRVRPVAFRDPEVKRAEATVAVVGERGEVLRQQVVAVNEPLVYRGSRIYLTAWGEDRYRNPHVGLQITRDPGQPLVWAGAVALSLGLFLLLFGDGAWAREEDGELWLRAGRALSTSLAGRAPVRGEAASSQQEPR